MSPVLCDAFSPLAELGSVSFDCDVHGMVVVVCYVGCCSVPFATFVQVSMAHALRLLVRIRLQESSMK